jgi:hypothetical protein
MHQNTLDLQIFKSSSFLNFILKLHTIISQPFKFVGNIGFSSETYALVEVNLLFVFYTVSRAMSISKRKNILKLLIATQEVLGCLLQKVLLQIEQWCTSN